MEIGQRDSLVTDEVRLASNGRRCSCAGLFVVVVVFVRAGIGVGLRMSGGNGDRGRIGEASGVGQVKEG